MKSDEVYVKHIRDAISTSQEYVAGMSEDDFLQSKVVQGAVIRELEIIGEATKHLSEEYRTLHAYIPWKDMAGMRDKLIHHYFGVDLAEVWKTVKDDLPEIHEALK